MDFSKKFDPSRIFLPSGLIALETPDSPSISGYTTTRTYHVRCGAGVELRDWFFDALYYNDFGGYPDLDNITIRRDTPVYDTVILSFSAKKTFAVPLAGDEAQERQFTLSDSGFSRPLEFHPEYRTRWNYRLYEFVPPGGESSGEPEWYDSATDLGDADGVTYVWAKEQPAGSAEGTWRMIFDMEKPGVTDYLETLPVIHEVRFYRSRKQRDNALRNAFSIIAPEETFGLSKEWLVTGRASSEDGKFYRIELDYTGADQWDPELYQAVTNG